MRVVITGGGGFLGSKLANALLARGKLTGPDGVAHEISKLVLLDTAFPVPRPADPRVEKVTGDLSDAAMLERVVTPDTASLFHLAAVVSGAAEADFDLGMRVNLDGTRRVSSSCGAASARPRRVLELGCRPSAAIFRPSSTTHDAEPANVVRGAESRERISHHRLLAQGLHRRALAATADDRRARRQAERGCVVLREQHPARAAERRGVRLPGRSRNRRMAAVAAPRDRVVHPRARIAGIGMGRQPRRQPARDYGERRANGRSARAGRRKAGRRAGALGTGSAHPRDRQTWPVRFKTPRALAMGFKPDENVESVIRSYLADEGIKL
jgi:hypothetical protein